MSFEQVVPAITTARFDLILSGMSDLPSRRGAMVFIDDMVSGAQFYINHDRAGQFSKATDLCGQKVGTEGSVDARTQRMQKRFAAALQGAETLPYLMQMEPVLRHRHQLGIQPPGHA